MYGGICMTRESVQVITRCLGCDRELDITEKTVWFLSHWICKAYKSPAAKFSDPVKIDEAYSGGKC